MNEIVQYDFINNKVVMNILFLVAYQIIMAIISYKVLEKYSWKEALIADCVITFGVAIIKLRGMDFFKIVITALVQAATMLGVQLYLYEKCDDLKDFIIKAPLLNTIFFGRRSNAMYTLD